MHVQVYIPNMENEWFVLDRFSVGHVHGIQFSGYRAYTSVFSIRQLSPSERKRDQKNNEGRAGAALLARTAGYSRTEGVPHAMRFKEKQLLDSGRDGSCLTIFLPKRERSSDV